MCQRHAFNNRGGSWSIIKEIRFPTYVLNRRGLPVSQVSTMVLSVQANTEVTGMFKILLPWQSNFVSSCAPHNSSRGMERRLIGETLVLATTISERFQLDQSNASTQHHHMHLQRHRSSHAITRKRQRIHLVSST